MIINITNKLVDTYPTLIGIPQNFAIDPSLSEYARDNKLLIRFSLKEKEYGTVLNYENFWGVIIRDKKNKFVVSESLRKIAVRFNSEGIKKMNIFCDSFTEDAWLFRSKVRDIFRDFEVVNIIKDYDSGNDNN